MSGLSRGTNADIFNYVPAGVVLPFAGDTAPQGWAICDGTAVSRAQYDSLFSALGVKHGEGDGSTTFNLPDYRGRFVRGADRGAGRDPDAGARTAPNTGGATGDDVGSVQNEELNGSGLSTAGAGGHNHSQNNWVFHEIGTGTRTGNTATKSYPDGGGRTFYEHFTDSIGNHSHTMSGGGSETRPSNAYVNYIIKL